MSNRSQDGRVERAMQELASFMPYRDLTEQTAFTPRMKELLTVTTKVKELDLKARHYLRKFLSERSRLLEEIIQIERKHRETH